MEKAYLITENTDLNTLKEKIDSYDRIYFWDAYCEHNLMYFLWNAIFIEKIIKIGKPLTLTTPIISEKNKPNLIEFFEKIKDIENFEVVVNDYWVLYILEKFFPQIKKIWWNFLSGQNKDPFLKIFKDKEVHQQITIDNSFYHEYLKKKNIDYIELYNTFQWFQLKNNYEITLYYPYTVYSINRYCPTKLIHDKKDYLTIVEDCDGCKWKIPPNFNMNLKMKTDMSQNFFRWNKQFYENNELIIHPNIKRIIYNHDLLW